VGRPHLCTIATTADGRVDPAAVQAMTQHARLFAVRALAPPRPPQSPRSLGISPSTAQSPPPFTRPTAAPAVGPGSPPVFSAPTISVARSPAAFRSGPSRSSATSARGGATRMTRGRRDLYLHGSSHRVAVGIGAVSRAAVQHRHLSTTGPRVIIRAASYRACNRANQLPQRERRRLRPPGEVRRGPAEPRLRLPALTSMFRPPTPAAPPDSVEQGPRPNRRHRADRGPARSPTSMPSRCTLI